MEADYPENGGLIPRLMTAMAAQGRQYLLDAWWLTAIPGMAILLVSLAFNLLGDGLRDLLDPKHA